MSTREAIESLLDNEAWDFRSGIEDELMSRVEQAIQTKRFEVGAEMFEEKDDIAEETQVDEEVEELDELSPALLNRAGTKATAQTAAARRGFGTKSPAKAGAQAAKFRMGEIMRKKKEKEKAGVYNFANGK